MNAARWAARRSYGSRSASTARRTSSTKSAGGVVDLDDPGSHGLVEVPGVVGREQRSTGHHRQRAHGAPRSRRQPRDTCGDGVAHSRRRRDRCEELVDEERIASGDPPRLVGIPLGAGHEVSDGGTAERRHLDAHGVRRRIAEGSAERVVGPDLRTGRHDQQSVRRPDATADEADDVGAGIVDPVRVLDHDDCRLAPHPGHEDFTDIRRCRPEGGDVAERAERAGHAQRLAPSPSGPDAGQCGLDDPGLARARFAGHDHEAALTVSGVPEHEGEPLEDVLALHETNSVMLGRRIMRDRVDQRALACRMTRMTPAEIFELLSTGTRTAHVASTRADGSPHVAPVWFLADGTPDSVVIHFTTSASSVKGRTLRHDGRVAITVDDPHPPFAFVIVEGTAELDDDLGRLLEVATRLGERYMGPARAVEFGTRNAVDGELLVTVRPVKLLGEKDLTA